MSALQWITDTTRAEVIRRIQAGEYRCDIARSCQVSEYSVTKIAIRSGLKIAKCAIGSRRGKANKVVSVTVDQTEVQKWKGAKANARWGGGYVR